MDDLVKALELDGISKSQVSRLCEELDTEVERFRSRKLEGTYPYLWLDATFLEVSRHPTPCKGLTGRGLRWLRQQFIMPGSGTTAA